MGYDKRSLDRRTPFDLGTHRICFELHRYEPVSSGFLVDQFDGRTLQGLSLSQLSFAVAHASHASIARSLDRLVEVLPSASSFSWTAWCRCRTSLVIVSWPQHVGTKYPTAIGGSIPTIESALTRGTLVNAFIAI
jgi:hypothetical protein